MENENKPKLPDFGKPLDTKLLLGFAEITNADKSRAVIWWDEHASPEWIGVLVAPPKKKP